MPTEKNWTAEVAITEEGRTVTARARLSGRDGEGMTGEGTARCNPRDENVPEIGDELATARALADLSHQLLHAAASDIESHTHQPVTTLRV